MVDAAFEPYHVWFFQNNACGRCEDGGVFIRRHDQHGNDLLLEFGHHHLRSGIRDGNGNEVLSDNGWRK